MKDEVQSRVLIHIGCGPFIIDGFQNIDSRDESAGQPMFTKHDVISDGIPYQDDSVDGIVSMHFLVEIPWREIKKHFEDCHRVLKEGGVLRLGVPFVGSGFPVDHLLGWGNINLFCEETVVTVLESAGFRAENIFRTPYRKTASGMVEITQPDNRPDETMYIEAIK